jgi:AcrR family transcriptional regulator
MASDPDIDPRDRPYHHGDLRRALLDAAVRLIAEHGTGEISLRELARRVGVSHAASSHHFGDKAGLLTAVATEGNHLLAAALHEVYADTGSFLEVGAAYVRFAIERRPYFTVMYRPELHHTDDPELTAAKQASREMLYGPVRQRMGPDRDATALEAGIAAWSMAHGLAMLWLDGNLPPQLGEDPVEIARLVLTHVFTSPR